VKRELAGQRPGRRRTDDEDQTFAGGRVRGLAVRDVEVGPFGETPLGGVAAFRRATHLAQRGVQPVAMTVRRELVLEIKVEPVTA
jgi:hypothetical protein